MEREPGQEYILSLSYGKDSIACLFAIEELGWPLDRIVHAEVWATDTIQADLPPRVEFKEKADEIIKKRWGIEVEHVFAMRDGKKLTYEDLFYHIPVRKCKSGGVSRISDCQRALVQQQTQDSGIADGLIKLGVGARNSSHPIYGWPHQVGGWCKRFKHNYLFGFAPWTGRSNKYCPVSRHCVGRARADHPPHKAGVCSPAGGDRLGRSILPTDLRGKRLAFPDLHNRNPGRMLVLPQSGR